MRQLTIQSEHWPLLNPFRISRGSKTEAVVVTVSISENGITGVGECLPYPRYNESVESVTTEIQSIKSEIESRLDRNQLLDALPAGAARNAVDCALLDLECKTQGMRAWEILQIAEPVATTTAYTLSLDNPDTMAANAATHAHRGLLKLKLGPQNALECVREVRRAAPASRLIVDANEGWTLAEFEQAIDGFAALDVAMVEQPLAAGTDAVLAGKNYPVALGADESCHATQGLAELAACYQVVNLKLDKTGGVTEALRVRELAASLNLDVMVGCMIATSLSMAPAMLITPGARFVDLDGPLLLAKDRDPGLYYASDQVYPPKAELWG
jgi:L-Ala-D/L-Glu epimerase